MAELCNHCNKAQATIHITNVDAAGELAEIHLCVKCADEQGGAPATPVSGAMAMVEKFVAEARGARGATASLVCEHCGMSYVEFRNQGLLGCPHDYDVFREALLPLIARAHDGATKHVGKSPRAVRGAARVTEQDIQRLKRLLAEAVAGEDYERAAELRDRIARLERS